MNARFATLPAILVLVLALPACSVVNWDRGAPTQSARSGQGERSSRGNPPFYEVFGERYYVLNTSYGYSQRGVASWYGKKFHGKPTSSGEIYDMHDMTAAHKTLPLPTVARVTNLQNGRSVVVKINDRGPFIDNRIIDLSYAAARQLDMITNGTALVEVEALGADPAARAQPAVVLAEVRTDPSAGESIGTSGTLSPVPAAAAATMPSQETISLYLQIGAFGEQLNAEQLRQKLESSGFENVVIRADTGAEPKLYRVRLGPIGGVDEYDALVQKMATMQIQETHLVMERSDGRAEEISAIVTRKPSGG